MGIDGLIPVEVKLLPLCLLLSILGHVLPMCLLRTWMQGYYGAVSVTQLSPWYLCNVGCLQCTAMKPHIDCFWMDDWAGTGFGEESCRLSVLPLYHNNNLTLSAQDKA